MTRRALCTVAAVLAATIVLAHPIQARDVNVTVDSSTTHQEMEGWGGRYVSWCKPVEHYFDEYFNALESLEPGEVSEPIETEAGYYILKQTESPKGEEGSKNI